MSLTKLKTGPYHKNEWSIIGAPCEVINALAAQIFTSLSKDIKIAYLDETHDFENFVHNNYTSEGPILDTSNFDVDKPRVSHLRKYFDHLDLLLLNGNHYKADKQIVIINEKKKVSLHKKLDRLTNVKMILVDNSTEEIYPYLKDHLHTIDQRMVLNINNNVSICEHILSDYKSNIPLIHGLVLTGGQSKRMGEDKARIEYHGKTQLEHVANMLSQYVESTWISVAHDHNPSDSISYQLIKDSYINIGPLAGILSAFKINPNVAWLTIACDLPYLNQSTIDRLVSERDSSKLATCYYNDEKKSVEPLVTIWEPRAYPALLDYLSMGYPSPSKILMDHDVNMIKIEDYNQFTNVNDPHQRTEAIKDFKK